MASGNFQAASRLPFPQSWSRAELRKVIHEKHVHVDTTAAAKILVFTAASYKKFTGKDPLEDGLSVESMVTPDGKEQNVYKVPGMNFAVYSLHTTGH